MSTIREKVEQGIIPVKAELIWFLILVLAIAGVVDVEALNKETIR